MQATLRTIQSFIRLEASGGIVLILAMLVALALANSGMAGLYEGFLSTNLRVGIGTFEISKPALLWINDGLMAIFFFLVGLEIKREVLSGELSSVDKALLPLIAAIGGMAIPALVFFWINMDSPANMSGWAIPAATDIAFALGVLALFGSRVPVALKVFLLAVAIIDDLGAIIIIAIFYTSDLSINALTLSMMGFVAAVALNRLGVKALAPYLIIGVFMWACVLKSGVHATLAGVLIALAIPTKSKGDEPSLLHRLEHALHPWAAFLILPVFAFANAGVRLEGVSFDDLLAPLPLGIAAGLYIGKQIGVFGATWLAVKSGVARLPQDVNWAQAYGVACLTGIGFTMSLFIGSLAFTTDEMMNAVRIGVLMGSGLSAITGFAVLHFATTRRSISTQTQSA
ncbi:MAG: Na+/H+ antiporter NhaA [Pseudomonadota bacterium]